MRKFVGTLLAIALLAGCAGAQTQYSPMRLTGGYSDKRIDEHQFEVTTGSNGFTSRSFALDAAFLRAAELTLENAHDSFRIISIETDLTPNNNNGGSSARLRFEIQNLSEPMIGCGGNRQPTRGILLPTAGTVCNARDIHDYLAPPA